MMLTIEPCMLSRRISFAASCIRKNGARTLTANMASNSAGSVSQIVPRSVMPAELTRGDEAFEHFEAALASEEALGARLWAARARVDCARALLARGGAPARAHAAKLLEEALGAARSGGWAEVTRDGRELEAALWTGRGSAARGPRARRRPSES
jgi:hypothetical protein